MNQVIARIRKGKEWGQAEDSLDTWKIEGKAGSRRGGERRNQAAPEKGIRYPPNKEVMAP